MKKRGPKSICNPVKTSFFFFFYYRQANQVWAFTAWLSLKLVVNYGEVKKDEKSKEIQIPLRKRRLRGLKNDYASFHIAVSSVTWVFAIFKRLVSNHLWTRLSSKFNYFKFIRNQFSWGKMNTCLPCIFHQSFKDFCFFLSIS